MALSIPNSVQKSADNFHIWLAYTRWILYTDWYQTLKNLLVPNDNNNGDNNDVDDDITEVIPPPPPVSHKDDLLAIKKIRTTIRQITINR